VIAHISDLLKSIATLLWPLIVFWIILRFSAEIRELLRRFRKGKLLGQEIELDPEVKQLNNTVETAASETPAQPIEQLSKENSLQQTDAIQDVLNEIKNSPKTALMKLSNYIESELRHLISVMGLLGSAPVSTRDAIKLLEERGSLPRSVASSVDQFMRVRNLLMHESGTNESKENILSSIDSGIHVLKMIRAIPHEINTVYATNVPVFEDKECQHVRSDVHAIILETKSPGGARTMYRVFPTTRNDYVKGKQVSWEWNMKRKWSQSWYRDPQTNDIKDAWGTSAEFVGRHLHEIDFPN